MLTIKWRECTKARRDFFPFLSRIRAFAHSCFRASMLSRFRAFAPLRLQPCITIIFLCVILLSCTKPAFYEKFQTIDKQWDKDTEYYFIFEIEDNSASYDLSLQIRNNSLYPYQNLWLFCTEQQPEGTVLRDTVECILADNSGKWIGSGISIYHLSVTIRTGYIFPQTGKYTFNIRQGMRDDRLKGIEQIGLQIEKKL